MGVSRVLKTVAEAVRPIHLSPMYFPLNCSAFIEEGREDTSHQQARPKEGRVDRQGLAGLGHSLQHLTRYIWSYGS